MGKYLKGDLVANNQLLTKGLLHWKFLSLIDKAIQYFITCQCKDCEKMSLICVISP